MLLIFENKKYLFIKKNVYKKMNKIYLNQFLFLIVPSKINDIKLYISDFIAVVVSTGGRHPPVRIMFAVVIKVNIVCGVLRSVAIVNTNRSRVNKSNKR